MRMFSSLTERKNVLRELKKLQMFPMVSDRHVDVALRDTNIESPPRVDYLIHSWCPLNTIILSGSLCRITRVWNIARPFLDW